MRLPAPGGGAVQAETTPVTCGALVRYSAMSAPAARAAGPYTPSGAVTMKISCMSDCPNLSVSSCVAREDSAEGS